MAGKRAWVGAVALALVAPVAPRACGGAVVREAKPVTPECADDERVYGDCVGVPAGRVCAADPCTDNVSCARVVVVHDDDELTAAASEATVGTCLALVPGEYGEVLLQGGVSLLGRSADLVHVEGAVVVGGFGSTLRGITFGASGVVVDGTTEADVDAVRVEGSTADGIELTGGAHVAVTRSEVHGAGHFGLSARGDSELTLHSSIVVGADAGAVVLSCDEGCGCAEAPALDLDGVLLKDNRAIGVWLWGARATVRRLVIDGSLVDEYFEGGSGVVASECAELDLEQATLRGCTGQGILVHHASASIGGPADVDQVLVEGAAGGVWIQSIATLEQQEVRLERVRILKSLGVGLGVTGHSSDVFLRSVEVADTELRALPETQAGGVVEVGDGVVWADRSFVDVEDLIVSGSARASFLIDGEVAAGSRLAGVALLDGDASKGIVQQRCPSWGSSPESGPGTPPIEQTEDEVYPLPWE